MRNLHPRDEREASVDRAGDRLAYIVLSFGLLFVVAYRSFIDGQTSWDLLGLVVIGGLVGVVYRVWYRALDRDALALVGVTVLIALAVGVAITLGLGVQW